MRSDEFLTEFDGSLRSVVLIFGKDGDEMAKAKKVKAPKSSSKKSKTVEAPFMPTIVEGLAKLVERLELLERKVDQVNSRISNLVFELRDTNQQNNRQNASHQQNPFGYSQPQQNQNIHRERMMYQAVCADCRKNCEVPFKPGDRPVYCKECFAARKAGNQDSAPKQASAPASVAVATKPKASSAKTKKKK